MCGILLYKCNILKFFFIEIYSSDIIEGIWRILFVFFEVVFIDNVCCFDCVECDNGIDSFIKIFFNVVSEK